MKDLRRSILSCGEAWGVPPAIVGVLTLLQFRSTQSCVPTTFMAPLEFLFSASGRPRPGTGVRIAIG